MTRLSMAVLMGASDIKGDIISETLFAIGFLIALWNDL